MIADLSVPFVDARADALAWWLGDDAPPALATLRLTSPAGALELRLLGASHHVVAEQAGVRCPEVVACGAGGQALPGRSELPLPGGRYAFSSRTDVYSPAGLGRVARDLRRRYAGDPTALLGAFPGSPHALTVLSAQGLADGWAWRSWHVYPTTGEVVRTRSRLSAGAAA